MKTILGIVVLATSLATIATGALANSPAYCQRVAQRAVDQYTHPAGSALVGCGAGALLGQVLSHGKGAAVIGGCGAGAIAGVAISSDKQQRIYNDAYNNCMYGSVPPPAAYAPPPPPPPPGPYKAYWSHQGTTTGNPSANVRAGQGTGFPVVYALPYGTNVSVRWCSDGGWCKLDDGNWISQSIVHFN
jgi:hypothetical protein